MPGPGTFAARRVWTTARVWHTATALITAFALLAQLVVAITGESDTAVARVVRYVSYFTIQSNILVCVTTALLAAQPDRDGPTFRVFRLIAVICITVTGIVHFIVLRPLPEIQNLTGWAQFCDIALHIVVPILAFTGWLVFGPRPRVTGRTVWLAVIFPIAWLVYTLVRGAFVDWYPYPFVDVAKLGYGSVLANCLAVAALFLACGGLALVADRRLPPTPATE